MTPARPLDEMAPPQAAGSDALLLLLLRNSRRSLGTFGGGGGDAASKRLQAEAAAAANLNCDKRACDLSGRQLAQLIKKRVGQPGRRLISLISLSLLLMCLGAALLVAPSAQQAAIIINHHHQQQLKPATATASKLTAQTQLVAPHFQPASLVVAQNKSINFTHLIVDELTNSIYLGATNWLFQLNARDLKLEQAIRTGPALSGAGGGSMPSAQVQQQASSGPASGPLESARDCSPADCLTQLAPVLDLESLALSHAHNALDLAAAGSAPGSPAGSGRRFLSGATMHTSGQVNGSLLLAAVNGQRKNSAAASSQTPATTPSSAQLQQQQQQPTNNYNKILAIDYESRQLIVCGSLNQGACRRHQLGNLGNFSELIPLPVASNDEHSSTVALIPNQPMSGFNGKQQQLKRAPAAAAAAAPTAQSERAIYVAATNSRLGPYREMVPAISARSLDFSSRDKSMQIIERSFTDSARVDISFELRDYYLVNYVHAFQHRDFVYFVTVQRKSPLRQLEEQGYATRLARLCLNDLSFQSYTEMTLECVGGQEDFAQRDASSVAAQEQGQQFDMANQVLLATGSDTTKQSSDFHSSSRRAQQQQQNSNHNKQAINYNLMQAAHVMQAGSQLQQQLNLKSSQAVLVGAFAQSRDHTTKSGQRSALCLFPMDQVEARFNENIELCYNGTSKARNMNYIAGSVNDCPRNQAAAPTPGNYCNEPIKLNGSLSLVAEPIVAYENELLSAVSSTLAPTAPLNIQSGANSGPRHSQSTRQHQVLLVGTSEGRLKRLVLVANSATQKIRALEFDSLQVSGGAGEQTSGDTSNAILADLSLTPQLNPQLQWTSGNSNNRSATGNANNNNKWHQYAIVASAHKVVRVRVNSCRAKRGGQQGGANGHLGNTSTVDECLACAQVQDPFCGWCSSAAACTTRDECLTTGLHQATTATGGGGGNQPLPNSIHWTPFDSIRCSNYQPVTPKNVPLQADAPGQLIDVNVRLNNNNNQQQQQRQAHLLAAKLARAQFACHFDYLTHWNRSNSAENHHNHHQQPRPSGATTKAAQARLNLHANTVAIGCPLPAFSQRPSLTRAQADQLKVRLSVRLQHQSLQADQADLQENLASEERALVERALGMRRGPEVASTASVQGNDQQTAGSFEEQQQQAEPIERELTLYDCTAHYDCHSCLTAGSMGRRWSCVWCPLSQKCTHNASHADFGCAAGAVASTTPLSLSALESQQLSAIRGSHLTPSLDSSQASLLALSLDKLHQCPVAAAQLGEAAAAQDQDTGKSPHQPRPLEATPPGGSGQQAASEILVPNNSRRSIQVTLTRPIQHFQREKRVIKLECLIELEGAKARLPARLLDNSNVACQETLLGYQAEVALQKAQLSVLLNDNQAIETTEVILYKCHLFGVNPPALTSSVVAAAAGGGGGGGLATAAATIASQHSSASWPQGVAEFLSLMQASGAINQQQSQQAGNPSGPIASRARQSDCSLCANIERKFQCAWCANQCKHAEQCGSELVASTCPPPRIDLIHPTSGPLEGGTLLTIEGSNLGSNEREIQDKILVGGEQCQLVMYSVSTRIVCKTGPSFGGPQAATVFVGNRAGVTSAYEKFHYKAVHLADVSPRVGPVSGGTRLYLSGTNLNVGSRIRVFLDDIPCPLDSNYEITSHQLVCITAPNLAVSSMRVARLTLLVDNSSHHLPLPFTYQPDPIITQIEPAESFLAGGRLLLVQGQHLASPQTSRLVVFHEQRPSISNSTPCARQGDTLLTCTTPAFSRELLLSAAAASQTSGAGGLIESSQNVADADSELQEVAQTAGGGGGGGALSALSHEAGGVKLKMMLLMDDVKSTRNLDEYYHHLPHYLTYYENPRLFKLPNGLIEFSGTSEELSLPGEHLKMRQLEQDMMIYVGAHVCPIKAILSDRIICQPPARIAPLYDQRHRLIERPKLAIVALIGSHLRYELGLMQYSSAQYAMEATQGKDYQASQATDNLPNTIFGSSNYNFNYPLGPPATSSPAGGNPPESSPTSYAGLIVLGLLGFVVAFALTLLFAMARFRQSKAKAREYKRIQQLQMGSLDLGPHGQPLTAAAFASNFHKIHLAGAGNQAALVTATYNHQQQQLFGTSMANQQQHQPSGKSKPFYQFFTAANSNSGPASFPPSPLTDISSLVGASPAHQQQQQQVKLNAAGTVVTSNVVGQPPSSGGSGNYTYATNSQTINSGASSSSPGGSSSSRQLLATTSAPASNQVQHYAVGQLQPAPGGERQNLLIQQQQQQQQRQLLRSQATTSSSRNFNWTQEAPATIVPYAVIEACNLTLEGKNAIKEYV